MTAQLAFDVDAPPRARRTDDQASHDAAARVRAGKYDAEIYDLLQHRSLTKNEICRALKLTEPRAWTTVASRLSQLKRAGKLEWDGRVEGDGNRWRLRERPMARYSTGVVDPVDVRNGAL
jgi:hypothetical protein